ncbi:hypothetical protein [Streptomyces sp. WAC 06725]|uniref:hypothetical protein n=1 Tax=Streptomyces sp. WAC 06725 TaxID=2203209 RepID=UPI00163B9AC3|nr:hypothetical protein [Streptomyces sp. WAC 06725]
MSDTLDEILSGLSATDVEIDAHGRIKVKDPQVAKQLRELSDAPGELLGNNSNCNHGC